MCPGKLLQLDRPLSEHGFLGLKQRGVAPARERLRLPDHGQDPPRLLMTEEPLPEGRSVADPVESALCLAPAGGEVDEAVRAHFQIRDIEGLALNEPVNARSGRVGGSVAGKARNQNPPARPVRFEQRVAVARGIHVVLVELHSHR